MSTHKKRADWFQDRTCFPFRENFPRDLIRKPTNSSSAPSWKEVGPTSSGGRLTCLAIDPKNPKRIYAGAAGGGVWRSENCGSKWVPAWSDAMPTLNIGSLAISPSAPEVVYCGTGEANLSGDNYPGTGLFVTRDRGATWKLVGDTEVDPNDFSWDRFPQLGLPRRIGSIAVDPIRPGHVFVGGISHSEQEIAGLFEKSKSASLWELAQDDHNTALASVTDQFRTRSVFISTLNYFCHSVVFHPAMEGRVIFAAVEARGSQSGIWMSRNGGKSWRQARHKRVLPDGDQFGRVSLALSPNSDVVWALAGQQGTRNFLGVFRSEDLGETWERFDVPALARDGQMSYTNCIAVHPKDPKIAIAGTLNLHRTVDGGKTWEQISNFDLDDGSPHYVHEDQHAIVIAKNGWVYSANDGGFSFSQDLGDTWETRNEGLAVSMFYDLDVAPFDSSCISGGMQDKGIWFQGPLDNEQRMSGQQFPFRRIHDGDGGWTCYNPRDKDRPFASRVRMELLRHESGDEWTQLAAEIDDADRKAVFQTIVTMTYGPSSGAPGVYMGSTRLWESLDNGDTWAPLSAIFDGSIITAIEVAIRDGDIIYVGTTNGGFFRGRRLRKGSRKWKWSRNLAGPMSPGRTITRITSDPMDANHVYYSVGSTAEFVAVRDRTARPSLNLSRGGLRVETEAGEGVIGFDHVYESHNGGATWSHTGGTLPNLPHNAVVVSTQGVVFAAHDAGVSVRHEGKWYELNVGLPMQRVTDLALHEGDHLLFASTYGRGIWKISLDEVSKWLLDRTANETTGKSEPGAAASTP